MPTFTTFKIQGVLKKTWLNTIKNDVKTVCMCIGDVEVCLEELESGWLTSNILEEEDILNILIHLI